MALKLASWTAATASGCCLLWLWMFREPVGPALAPLTPNPNPVGAATSPAVSGEMNRTTERLRLLQIRDSLVRASANTRADLVVLIDSGYGAGFGRALESALRARWNQLNIPAKVPVIIAAVVDSGSTVSGFPRRKPAMIAPPITAFLPASETGSRCISVVRTPAPLSERTPKFVASNLLAPQTVDALLSPCVYYAMFGAPGPAIEQWLRDSGWRGARHAGWSAHAPRWDDRVTDNALPMMLRLSSQSDPSWRLRYALTVDGVGCLAGESGRCLRAATDGRAIPGDSTWRANVVSSTGANQLSFYMPPGKTSLGPYDGWLLSEMARSLGHDRFATFWRSSASLPEAFRVASGQDLDSWIRDWANRIYGPVSIGPGVAWSAIISGMLAVGLAMGVALAVARDRRVM